jgi:hypothetical protein
MSKMVMIRRRRRQRREERLRRKKAKKLAKKLLKKMIKKEQTRYTHSGYYGVPHNYAQFRATTLTKSFILRIWESLLTSWEGLSQMGL